MKINLNALLVIPFIGLSSTVSCQTFNADSCGLDSYPVLNKYEILFVDSFLFHPFPTRKAGVIDFKDGFDFNSKKIAFYSCTINSETKGKGIISKQKFFELIKPTPKGHAGFNLMKFTEVEKKHSGGFDAIIFLDCPYYLPKKKQLIAALHNLQI